MAENIILCHNRLPARIRMNATELIQPNRKRVHIRGAARNPDSTFIGGYHP